MFSRRGAHERGSKTTLTRSKRAHFPALKRQVEIDLEDRLYVTEEPDEDSFLVRHEEVDAGPFQRIVLEPKTRLP